MNFELTTDRLELLATDAEIAHAAAEDKGKLAELIGAEVPDAWPPETMRDVMDLFAVTLETVPDVRGFWAWYIVLREGVQGNLGRMLVGSAGFAGKPTTDGTLTLGYSIIPDYEGKGYITEAARALIDWAFEQPNVNRVIAETYEDHAASIRIMEKLGMSFAGPGSEENLIKYCIEK